jgi:ankyrin repeat protein
VLVIVVGFVCHHDGGAVQSILGKKGINVNACDDKKRTALHFASTRNDCAIIDDLIAAGASPNARDLNGNTPLHLAACTRNTAVVTLLINAGTEINAKDNKGEWHGWCVCWNAGCAERITRCSHSVSASVQEMNVT